MAKVNSDREARVEAIARAFHWQYDLAAEQQEWDTQEATKVPWEELPEANRLTMLWTVDRLLGDGTIIAGDLRRWTPEA